MTQRARRSTLLLVLTTLAATALLAAGLPRLRLSPGVPLPSLDQGGIFLDAPGLASPAYLPPSQVALVVLAIGAAALVLHALWRALRGVRLWSLLGTFLRGLLVFAAVALAVLVLLQLVRPGSAPIEIPPALPPAPAPRTPLGDPPSLVLWLTAGAFALASGLAAAWMLRPRKALDVREALALEAERARTAILAGADARGVILACYSRMSAALAEDQGIERPGPMTAREFGGLVGSLGVPRSPVMELTRLFESVRYGRQQPTRDEEGRAIACLDPIVEHCRRARPGGMR